MTASELPKLLALLEQDASKLNSESNSINEIITSIEARLRIANPGVAVVGQNVTIADPISGDDAESGVVNFCKHGDIWGFFVSNRQKNHVFTPGMVPLTEVSRDFRIDALKQLPTLIEHIDEELKRKLRAIETAKALIN